MQLCSQAEFDIYRQHVLDSTGLTEREVNTRMQQKMEQSMAEDEQKRLQQSACIVSRIETSIRHLRDDVLNQARGKRVVTTIEAVWGAYRYQVMKSGVRGSVCQLSGKAALLAEQLVFVRQGTEEEVMLTDPILVSVRNMGVVKALMFVSRLRDYIRMAPTQDLLNGLNEAVELLRLFAESQA